MSHINFFYFILVKEHLILFVYSGMICVLNMYAWVNPSRCSMIRSSNGVLKYTMSEHYAVYTVINSKLKQDSIPHIFKSRDYKRFNPQCFLAELSTSLNDGFNTSCTSVSVHQAWQTWKTIFSKCSEKYAPLKTFRVRNSKQNFITPDIQQLMYRRDHLHSKAIKYSDQSFWDEYRKLRNYITYLINKSKRVFLPLEYSNLKAI